MRLGVPQPGFVAFRDNVMNILGISNSCEPGSITKRVFLVQE